ncbi:hypothetical protein PYCC9005_002986 [Savitreella phatthalungensis]
MKPLETHEEHRRAIEQLKCQVKIDLPEHKDQTSSRTAALAQHRAELIHDLRKCNLALELTRKVNSGLAEQLTTYNQHVEVLARMHETSPAEEDLDQALDAVTFDLANTGTANLDRVTVDSILPIIDRRARTDLLLLSQSEVNAPLLTGQNLSLDRLKEEVVSLTRAARSTQPISPEAARSHLLQSVDEMLQLTDGCATSTKADPIHTLEQLAAEVADQMHRLESLAVTTDTPADNVVLTSPKEVFLPKLDDSGASGELRRHVLAVSEPTSCSDLAQIIAEHALLQSQCRAEQIHGQIDTIREIGEDARNTVRQNLERRAFETPLLREVDLVAVPDLDALVNTWTSADDDLIHSRSAARVPILAAWESELDAIDSALGELDRLRADVAAQQKLQQA